MKYLSSQLSIFLRERGVRRNLGMFFRFLLVLVLMVVLYSILFHYLMQYEGRSYSWITGLYWTLTVMTTLGFGDITFTSDPGKLFSVVVLMTGVLCLLVMLPFAFIQYVYAPWLEAQKKGTVPRGAPAGLKGHIIVVGVSPVALDLVNELARYGFYCVLLTGDTQGALDLLDQGYHVIVAYSGNRTISLKKIQIGIRKKITSRRGAGILSLDVSMQIRNVTDDRDGQGRAPHEQTANKTAQNGDNCSAIMISRHPIASYACFRQGPPTLQLWRNHNRHHGRAVRTCRSVRVPFPGIHVLDEAPSIREFSARHLTGPVISNMHCRD